MSSNPSEPSQSKTPRPAKGEVRDATRIRRLQTLTAIWDLLVAEGRLNPNHLKLSDYLASEVVEHYLEELYSLKDRYKIRDRILAPKVAGLMTSAIVRLRPIVPLVDDCYSGDQMMANEILAIIYGLTICSEESTRAGHEFRLGQEAWFNNWFHNFKFLLHHRRFTAESLNFIYETLCWFRFPEAMVRPESDEEEENAS